MGDDDHSKRLRGQNTVHGVPGGPGGPGSPGGDNETGAFDRRDPALAPLQVGNTSVSTSPFIEVELAYVRGSAGMPTEGWQAVEVWTQNRVYVVDWNMRCIEVIDAKTREPDRAHALLGALLAGGQVQTEDGLEMTYPLPRPGTDAVFEYTAPRAGFITTSRVSRVVVRLRVLTVAREQASSKWDEITGTHWSLPEAKPK